MSVNTFLFTSLPMTQISNDLLTLQKVMNRGLRLVKKWLDAKKLAFIIDLILIKQILLSSILQQKNLWSHNSKIWP